MGDLQKGLPGSNDEELTSEQFSKDVCSAGEPENVFTTLAMEASVGVSGSIRDSICYLSEREIAYPVGMRVAYSNIETLEMSFLRLNAKIHAMCIAPNRLALAVAHEADEAGMGSMISIFHVATQKLLRQLRPTNSIGEIVTMSFSGDSKFLFTSAGPPRHEVFYWKWDAEKLIARSQNPMVGMRVHFHPTDNSIISISGPGMLRLWKLGGNSQLKLQPTMQPKKESGEVFIDHAWFDEKTLLVLHERGTCTIFHADASAATQTRSIKLNPVQSIHLQVREESDVVRAEVLKVHERGFIIAGSNGMLFVYEETTEGQEEPFMYVKTFQTTKKEIISDAAISPCGDNLVCCTRCNSLLLFPLGNVDIILENEDPFKPFPFVQHRGPVTSMDVCLGPRPLLITAGTDKLLRVINYETMDCEIAYQLTPGFGDPVAVAIHPSGSLIVVGFKEHVRIYDFLLGKLREKGCLYLKNCTCIRFGHGGHYLICSSNLTINLYGTYTATLLHSFSEHLGKVQEAVFNNTDSVLVSVSFDGSVFARRTENGQRLDDLSTAFETCQLAAVAINQVADHVIVAGTDGSLREISQGVETIQLFVSDHPSGVKEDSPLASNTQPLAMSSPSSGGVDRRGSQIDTQVSQSWKRRASTSDETITSLLLSKDEKILFAGTSTGAIRIYKFPLSVHRGRYEIIATHNAAITRLRRSFDGRFLFSSSRDGTCFVQKLYQTYPGATEDEEKLLNLRSGFRPGVTLWRNDADAVLVSHREWLDNIKAIDDTKKEMLSLQTAHDYAMHLKDTEWMEKVRAARSETTKSLGKERARFEELQQRYEHFVQKHLEEKQKMEANRVRTAQTIENEYEKRLGEALRRVDERSEAIENLRQKTDEILVAQETKHVDELETVKTTLGEQVQQLRKQVDQLERELAMERERHTESISQQQQEYDLELLHLKGAVETAVQKERSNLAIKQGQLVEQQNKFQRLRNKMSTMKVSKAEDETRIKNLEEQVSSLQSTLRRYEANLEQREIAFREKEKTILHLRSNQKTLDNFRYVLDHRIEKLMEEKGPIKEHIAKLETHIKAMYNELVSEFERKKVADRQMSTKQMKVVALSNEVNKLRANLRDREREVSSLAHTITTCAQTSDTKQAIYILAEAYRTQVLKEPAWSVRKTKTTVSTPVLPTVPSAGTPTNAASLGSAGANQGSGVLDQDHSFSNMGTGANPDTNSDVGSNAGQGGSDTLLGGANRSSVEETERQRDQMHKTVETLQKALRVSERRGHQKSKRQVQENALLITECNRLRKEAIAYKLRADELENKVAKLELRVNANQAEEQSFGVGEEAKKYVRTPYPTKTTEYGDDDVRQEDVSRPATRQGVPARNKRIPALPQRPGSK